MQDIHWQKSTYSGDGSNCVEISHAPRTIHVRDSKTPTGPHLTFPPTAWAGFLSYAAGRDR
ncbi:DUF397 domain-containing protein [Streptomyces sp. NPDC096152]|uniref:DUF397 domain-containing protein n=1 Tax=Streptomyces sp. NPDC096152 TaxID=3366078 RepID=UPI00382DE136